LDIVEIDAASRSSVEDARNLREQVQTLPAFSRYRIYIIDEAHMLSKQAFDALLKMLEEPPSHSIFILATTEIDRVPDTIKSRVQIFPFRLIPIPLIEARLQAIALKESIKLSPDSSRLIAETADGSMRDALTTLDRIVASTVDSTISEESVRSQLGVVPKSVMLEISDAITQSDTPKLIILLDSLANFGIDWIVFWKELVINFQTRLHSEIKLNSTPQAILKWARILQILVSRERDIKESSLPRVIVEITLVTLSNLPNLAPLESLLSPSAPSLNSETLTLKAKSETTNLSQAKVAKSDQGLDDLLKMTGGTIA
jgi:DNA polymerase-3 subunit gamma/tau